MGDPAGYQWNIEARGAHWTWTILSASGAVVLTGDAVSRAHAAACVVHALVQGMTVAPTLARAA